MLLNRFYFHILPANYTIISTLRQTFVNTRSSTQLIRYFGDSAMPRPKVLVTRADVPAAGIELLKEKCDVTIWEKTTPIPHAELVSKIRGMDGLFCLLTDKIDEEVLVSAGPQLKAVATMSVGYDHFDLKALKSRNIHLGYTPGVLTDATSELAVALLLATSRRIIKSAQALRDGLWSAWSPSFMCGPGLANSTVGIVGLGRIGARIGEYLKPFRVSKILYTSRSAKPEAVIFNGEHVTLDTLLAESDFVIVTIALTPDTREMFNEAAFKKMKKTAIFINVSRGEIVNQPALIQALKNKTIRAAGLDVMSPEPIPLNHELLKLDNCVLLPHIGSAAIETRREMSIITAKNILAVLEGKPAEMPAPLKL